MDKIMISGRLTAYPEYKKRHSGMQVLCCCSLSVRKDSWEIAHFFTVTDRRNTSELP